MLNKLRLLLFLCLVLGFALMPDNDALKDWLFLCLFLCKRTSVATVSSL